MPSSAAIARAVASRRAVIPAAASRARARIAGGALPGVPLSNGGSGAYCMPSWISRAASSPRSSAASCSAPSIPAVTPAANSQVRPSASGSITTRASTASAPNQGSRWTAFQ